MSTALLPSTTVAMLLADSRLPAGSHVSSNGLEPALRSGLHPSRVPEYVRSRMLTVARVEAGTAVVARAAVLEGADLTGGLARVSAEWAARTPSRSLRTIAHALGAGLSRLARSLWPEDEAIAITGARAHPRPVVLGAVAAASGLGAEDLARLVAYEDAQTVAAAALKLEPLDPAVPTRWVLDGCADFERFVPELAALTHPEAIPASGAPQIEEWAEAHASTTRRLFRA